MPVPRSGPPRSQPVPSNRLNMPALGTVWNALGYRGGLPPTYTARLPRGVAGQQMPFNRNVYLAPDVVSGLRSLGFPGHRNLDALRVLVHEYTHTQQPRVFPRVAAEGGAEVASEHYFPKVLRALGETPTRGDQFAMPVMPYLMAAARAHVPMSFMRRGQFGR